MARACVLSWASPSSPEQRKCFSGVTLLGTVGMSPRCGFRVPGWKQALLLTHEAQSAEAEHGPGGKLRGPSGPLSQLGQATVALGGGQYVPETACSSRDNESTVNWRGLD